MEAEGPDAPTLCEGWNTRDLAAHVVVRERRADAAGGLLLKQLAPRLERVQAEFAEKPYEELIQLIRTGPPRFSPFALKQIDEASNTVEFYVHRGRTAGSAGLDAAPAGPGLPGRPVVPPGAHRPSRRPWRPTGLVLRRPGRPDGRHHRAHPVVTVTGEPSELLLFALGRQKTADVELEGDKDAIAKLGRRQLGL